VRFPILGHEPPRIEARDGRPWFSFDPERMLAWIREERYAGAMRSPTRLVPFPYHRLPGAVRLAAARLLYSRARRDRPGLDPNWPVAPAADLLVEWTRAPAIRDWNGKAWALAITHDVDSHRGLTCAPRLAERVERAGFRSCFYVVGDALSREPDIARELFARGHEVGSHDLLHDNALLALAPGVRDDRLRRARESIAPFGGVGFRSPSLLRSAELIEAVGRHFDHDSSLCDSDLEFARGCATVRPYGLRGTCEIPITLPMDSSLRYIGHDAGQIVWAWRQKCRYVRAVGGLAVLVTHAEPHLSGGGALLEGLSRFLDWALEQDDLAVLLPSAIARLHAATERARGA
jgi:peptidoglycan/xylan/chitin deacetylase (PgdA/CDA1 family)